MESSIAGMLILSVLIVAVVLMSSAYVVSNTLLGTAIVESVNLADERSRTSLSIKSWDFATSTPKELTIEVENTGDTSIADYDKMDLFVNSERLEFATSTPATAGTWTLSDRTVWRPGTTREIDISTDAAMSPGAIVVVSSPNGVTEVGSISTPTPTPTPTPSPTPNPNQVIISCNNPTVTPSATTITVTCAP